MLLLIKLHAFVITERCQYGKIITIITVIITIHFIYRRLKDPQGHLTIVQNSGKKLEVACHVEMLEFILFAFPKMENQN